MGASASTVRVVGAGVGSVAVSFGLARYGYGLLLPDIRADLGLDSATLGLIATGSIAAYLVATVLAGALTRRLGPRTVVVFGGALAVIGMLVIASAAGPATLAAGILVAGGSSGLVFPPFADLVQARVAARTRPRALAAISSGTGWGVLASVPIALAFGTDWRTAWLVYAGVATITTLWAAWALRGGASVGPPPIDRLRPSWFVCPRSGPLLAGALLIGLGSSVYWTFAVDLVADEGGWSPSAARVTLAVVGAASLIGASGGDLIQRLDARPTLVTGSLALATALALIALAPGSWLAVVTSAVLFGAAYNVLIAVEAIWSARVFAGRPATGLAAVMFALGSGLLLGPLAAGLVAASAGLPAAFLGGSLVVASAALLLPAEELRERSAETPAAEAEVS